MLDLSRIVKELENVAEEITSTKDGLKMDNEIAFLKVCLKAYLNYLDYEACFNPNMLQSFIDEAREFEDKHWDLLKTVR